MQSMNDIQRFLFTHRLCLSRHLLLYTASTSPYQPNSRAVMRCKAVPSSFLLAAVALCLVRGASAQGDPNNRSIELIITIRAYVYTKCGFVVEHIWVYIST